VSRINILEIAQDSLNKDSNSMFFAFWAEHLINKGNKNEAFKVLHKGTAKNPKYMTGLLVLADLYFSENMLSESKECYEKVLLLDSQSLTALYGLAKIAFKKNENSIGVTHLFQILSIDPFNDKIHEELSERRKELRSEFQKRQDEPKSLSEEAEKAKPKVKREPIPVIAPIELDDESLEELDTEEAVLPGVQASVDDFQDIVPVSETFDVQKKKNIESQQEWFGNADSDSMSSLDFSDLSADIPLDDLTVLGNDQDSNISGEINFDDLLDETSSQKSSISGERIDFSDLLKGDDVKPVDSMNTISFDDFKFDEEISDFQGNITEEISLSDISDDEFSLDDLETFLGDKEKSFPPAKEVEINLDGIDIRGDFRPPEEEIKIEGLEKTREFVDNNVSTEQIDDLIIQKSFIPPEHSDGLIDDIVVNDVFNEDIFSADISGEAAEAAVEDSILPDTDDIDIDFISSISQDKEQAGGIGDTAALGGSDDTFDLSVDEDFDLDSILNELEGMEEDDSELSKVNLPEYKTGDVIDKNLSPQGKTEPDVQSEEFFKDVSRIIQSLDVDKIEGMSDLLEDIAKRKQATPESITPEVQPKKEVALHDITPKSTPTTDGSTFSIDDEIDLSDSGNLQEISLAESDDIIPDVFSEQPTKSDGDHTVKIVQAEEEDELLDTAAQDKLEKLLAGDDWKKFRSKEDLDTSFLPVDDMENDDLDFSNIFSDDVFKEFNDGTENKEESVDFVEDIDNIKPVFDNETIVEDVIVEEPSPVKDIITSVPKPDVELRDVQKSDDNFSSGSSFDPSSPEEEIVNIDGQSELEKLMKSGVWKKDLNVDQEEHTFSPDNSGLAENDELQKIILDDVFTEFGKAEDSNSITSNSSPNIASPPKEKPAPVIKKSEPSAQKQPPLPDRFVGDVSKKSKTTGDDSIATETMAEIYAAQGLTQEAINIYNKLIEKSSGELKDRYLMRVDMLKERLDN